MQTQDMIDDELAQIQEDQRRYGEPVRAPAQAEDIAHLEREAQRLFGVALPPGYLEFLRASDGLDYNGLVVYDTRSTPQAPTGGFWQGFVAANLAWRDDTADTSLIVFGDTDLDLLAIDTVSGQARRVDRIGRDRHVAFASFEAMLGDALARSRA